MILVIKNIEVDRAMQQAANESIVDEGSAFVQYNQDDRISSTFRLKKTTLQVTFILMAVS